MWVITFWWATWSLADAYLLRFTPVSELIAIALCILTVVASAVVRFWNATVPLAES